MNRWPRVAGEAYEGCWRSVTKGIESPTASSLSPPLGVNALKSVLSSHNHYHPGTRAAHEITERNVGAECRQQHYDMTAPTIGRRSLLVESLSPVPEFRVEPRCVFRVRYT
jgi:hypothetical protein